MSSSSGNAPSLKSIFAGSALAAAAGALLYYGTKRYQKYRLRNRDERKDRTSFANNQTDARSTHIHMDLTVDFKANILSGFVEHTVEVVRDGATAFVLDTKTLNVKKVFYVDSKTDGKVDLGAEHAIYGRALTIAIPEGSRKKGSKFVVRVEYETTKESIAIQWLDKSQTAGKEHPYLYTQCQAIHARTMLPCQDTPSNKTTYSARMVVPAPLVALMSAAGVGEATAAGEGQLAYAFEQKVPMPSYLIALAVGALEKRDIGPRSAVWSEKEMVDAGAHEFQDTEKFLRAAESIVGPYVWGRYDVLLLPPSFPYGGMENPCLTFVTPTLLAGDRSLANVVAHEIAHSWMGNLVTSHTWEHFWMNEGFTVFLERKILQALNVADRGLEYGRCYHHLHAEIGWEALRHSVYDQFGSDKHPHTVMNVYLDNVDPDDAFSSVPYEKGYNFLLYLENLVGGESVMNPFLRAHCEKFKFGTVCTHEWKAFFLSYFQGKVEAKKLATIDWDMWLHEPGMPPKPALDLSLANAAHELANDLVEKSGPATPSVDISEWKSSQILVMLEKMVHLQGAKFAAAKKAAALPAAKEAFRALLKKTDEVYHFSQTKNSEIRFKWLTLCVRAELVESYPLVVEFLTWQGRMKFTRPLFRDLFEVESGKELAIKTYNAHRQNFHSITAKMVGRDLGIKSE